MRCWGPTAALQSVAGRVVAFLSAAAVGVVVVVVTGRNTAAADYIRHHIHLEVRSLEGNYSPVRTLVDHIAGTADNLHKVVADVAVETTVRRAGSCALLAARSRGSFEIR